MNCSLHTLLMDMSEVQSLWENDHWFLKKKAMELPCLPEMPFLYVSSQEELKHAPNLLLKNDKSSALLNISQDRNNPSVYQLKR